MKFLLFAIALFCALTTHAQATTKAPNLPQDTLFYSSYTTATHSAQRTDERHQEPNGDRFTVYQTPCGTRFYIQHTRTPGKTKLYRVTLRPTDTASTR